MMRKPKKNFRAFYKFFLKKTCKYAVEGYNL